MVNGAELTTADTSDPGVLLRQRGANTLLTTSLDMSDLDWGWRQASRAETSLASFCNSCLRDRWAKISRTSSMRRKQLPSIEYKYSARFHISDTSINHQISITRLSSPPFIFFTANIAFSFTVTIPAICILKTSSWLSWPPSSV